MTTSAGSRPTTVIRATSTRFTTVLLGIAAAGVVCTPSLPSQTDQAMQPAPLKPSAAIPATPPTSIPSPNAVTSPLPPVQHLDVQFADGNISVEASNANLNQVLREVASKAGFKITGSVNDERVFGHYGPSSPSSVLAMLLDGTGANMLLVDDAKGASELILTARRGSPTPPNPNAAQEANSEEPAPASRYVPPIRPFQPPYQAGRPQVGQVPGPPAQPDANQTGADPNSTRQIYDQLQRSAQQGTSQDGANQQQPPPQ